MTHGFSRRIHARGWLAALSLGLVSLTAQAGYANLAAPAGWSAGASGATFQAANAAQWSGGVARASTVLNVAGRAITVPVGMRVAANASTYAARFMFANPYVLTAAAIAFLVAQNVNWDELSQRWIHSDPAVQPWPQSDGFLYYATVGRPAQPSPSAACTVLAEYFTSVDGPYYYKAVSFSESSCVLKSYYKPSGGPTPADPQAFDIAKKSSSCPAGWYITDQGCVQTAQPATTPQGEEDFVTRVAPYIPPEVVPQYLPYTAPIPVEPLPVVNPSDDPQATPRPLLVPVGEPRPVPNSNPQSYSQPFIRITPAPTADQPWQVDVSPFDRVTTDPTAVREPITDPATDTAPKQDTESDLCQRNPDIDACQKTEYDTPDGDIPTDSINASYAVDNFLSGGGSCPADVYVTVHGTTYKAIDWAQQCGYMTTYARPLVLVVCAFVSVMIVAGGFKV